MAVAPIERSAQTPNPVQSACAALADCAREVSLHHLVLSRPEALQLIVDIEQASRIVDHLQVLAARLAAEHYAANEPEPAAPDSAEPASEEPGPGWRAAFTTVEASSLLARAGQDIRADAPTRSGSDTTSRDAALSGTPDTAFSDAASSNGDGAMSPMSGAVSGGFRDCADFLRATLGISRSEARRRLGLAELVLPRMSPTGAVLPARLETLGAATDACLISGRAATIVSQALRRVHTCAAAGQLESMEQHLTRQAPESDEDILRVLAHRWEGVLDQDGQEPSEKALRARQGVFLKGHRHGLHILEIGATDEQFEHLATVMNTTASPRVLPGRAHAAGAGAGTPGAGADAGPGEDTGSGTATGSGTEPGTGAGGSAGLFRDPGGATRAQMLLEGLVAACRIALTTAALPSTGGHRPQVMVTIDYKDLLGETQRPGQAVFCEQVSARSIRQLACDADIIPLVLGGKGQVLDIGRAQRLFPPHLRRALAARDKGCAFPDCSIPASWCEAHHIRPWSHGGSTSTNNGVLLCSRHHHLIHQDHWRIEIRAGIPWFHAPGQPGRAGTPRTNRYWQAGRIVHDGLLHEELARGELSATDVLPQYS